MSEGAKHAAHGGVILTLLDVCLCMAARTLHPGSAGIMTITMNSAFTGGGTDPLKAEARDPQKRSKDPRPGGI